MGVEGTSLKHKDGGWIKLCPWQPISHCFINCSVAEGVVEYIVFCFVYVYCCFLSVGWGNLKHKDCGWIKAVSLTANKSLLHKRFGGT